MYSGKLLKADLLGSKHYFINSNSFFGGPLKKMGEAIGLPKLDGDVTNPEYVKRDAEIVYRFMVMFQKQINDMGINLGITIGQLAMGAYRRNYMEDSRQITYNSPNCLKAYYGGRVEIFYKGAIEDVKVSDINSSYPNVMANFPYPDTSTIEPSSIDTHEFGIGKFKIHVPESTFIPTLPIKSKAKRLFFPTGTFTGWWTYAEVRDALSHGAKIIKEYSGEGTNRACMPFVSFIEDFYEKRLEAKARKNDFEVLFYKLFMNNLYGKWCQHKGGSTINREPMSAGMAERQKVTLDRKLGNFYCYSSEKDGPPRTANFLWGVYITSYARLELLKGLREIHNKGGTVIYCDTDSIMFNGVDSPLPIGKELGLWDEEKFDLGVFRQAKGYLLCNKKDKEYEIEKVACKGVNTDFAYDFIVRGMAKVMKPMRFKESIVRISADVNKDKGEEFEKAMGVNVWREVEKSMNSLYIKRVGDKIMYPVDYKKIPEIEEGAIQPNLTIEKDLKKQGYHIKRKEVTNNFANIKIPAGWFKRNEPKKREILFHGSQNQKWLKASDCAGLEAGDIWFSGHVHSIENGKFGKYYRILLTNFRGQETPASFWGAISVKFFRAIGHDDNLVGFFVDMKLKRIYLDKKPLIIDVQFSDSELCARSEDVIEDIEHLSQEETENLASADWSFLDGLKT
jgi:hypothetical protein